MDQLEKLITGCREEIQNDLPHEGHFERFEMKLNAKAKKRPKYRIGYRVSVAAAAVIVAALIIFIPGKQQKNTLTLSRLSPQYADVEYYYTNAINKQAQKLATINKKTGNDQTIDILIEEMKAYDKNYNQLCKDLNATPNDERVINALITYYQTKLEIINKILNEIENKQKNKKNHENVSI